MSTTSIFVRIDDGRVKGSATSLGAQGDLDAAAEAEKYETWILADSVSFGLNRDQSAGSGSSSGGGAAGGAAAAGGASNPLTGLRTQAGNVRITKQVDLSSCGLIRLLMSDEPLAEVKIDICAPTGTSGKFQWYMRYVLGTCTVLDYKLDLKPGQDGSTPTETIEIDYNVLVTRFRVWGEENKPTRDAPEQKYDFTEAHDDAEA